MSPAFTAQSHNNWFPGRTEELWPSVPAVGVLDLTLHAGHLPWIALVLAFSLRG